jgi:hypothetical protein
MYRLALQMGRWDVDNLIDEMTPEAIADWVAFAEFEPMGLERVEIILAQGFIRLLAAEGITYELEEFLPWLPDYKQSADEIAAKLGSANSVLRNQNGI